MQQNRGQSGQCLKETKGSVSHETLPFAKYLPGFGLSNEMRCLGPALKLGNGSNVFRQPT